MLAVSCVVRGVTFSSSGPPVFALINRGGMSVWQRIYDRIVDLFCYSIAMLSCDLIHLVNSNMLVAFFPTKINKHSHAGLFTGLAIF